MDRLNVERGENGDEMGEDGMGMRGERREWGGEETRIMGKLRDMNCVKGDTAFLKLATHLTNNNSPDKSVRQIVKFCCP